MKLYRTVSLAELDDLLQNGGVFRDSIHRSGEKAFFCRQQDAIDMARSFERMEGHPHRVVMTDAPLSIVERGRSSGAAQEGTGVYLPSDDLDQLSPAVELEA
jgi:hypothetical protein